jgi:hypothetical protein
MNLGQWAGHIVLFGSALLTLVVFLAVKLWRKLRERRSPLGGRASIGHLPGQQLLKRIRHHDDELGRAIFLAMMAAPLMFMVWASLSVQWVDVRWATREWMFAIGAVLMFLWGLYDYIHHYKKREQYQDGWIAEQVTGQQLNRLVARGCQVLHDLPAEVGNIDHVVIAPRGVYAVETKSFRKPKGVTDDRNHPGHKVHYDGKGLRFPDFATAKPIEQAIRQAHWLRCTLRDGLGREVPVIPAVALPGWWVERSEESKGAEVQVFTPMGKGADFMAWQPERLDESQRRLIAQTLAARYPVIEA